MHEVTGTAANKRAKVLVENASPILRRSELFIGVLLRRREAVLCSLKYTLAPAVTNGGPRAMAAMSNHQHDKIDFVPTNLRDGRIDSHRSGRPHRVRFVSRVTCPILRPGRASALP